MKSSIATAPLPEITKVSPAAPLRLCFIGCGARARAYAEVASECPAVSSFAGTQWFRPENAPAGATARCTDPCPHSDGDCNYSALRYLTDKKQPWLPQIMPGWATASDDEILDWLRTGDWGRCVYTSCGHDTADHQVVSLQFASGVEVEDPAENGYAGHGGGDFGLIDSLHELISAPGNFDNTHFMQGHLIVFAADEAFHSGKNVAPTALLNSSNS